MAKQQTYTMKQRYDYHKRIANSGKDINGKSISMTSRINHANRANQIHNQMNRFMSSATFVKNNFKK